MALIIGRKPVLEAINSNKNIEQVILRFGQSGGIINAIRAATKKRNIKLTELSKNKFDELVPNKNSQGVAAKISEREYLTLDELILQTKNGFYGYSVKIHRGLSLISFLTISLVTILSLMFLSTFINLNDPYFEKSNIYSK